ncbi:MAG: hypothetical protein GY751_16085 [Bacteroidetes bacterium]|nr:hypothetical protein [Bacteroidota bacterium]
MKLSVTLGQVYTGHAEAIYALEPGMSAHQLYSGSGDGFVGLWDFFTGVFEKSLAKLPAGVYSLKKHPDSSVLFIGLQNGQLFILDLNQRKVLKNIQISSEGLFDMAYSKHTQMLYVADGQGCITVLDTNTYEVVRSVKLSEKAIRTINESPCGRFLITGSSDHHFYFLEITDEIIVRQSLKAHGSSIFTAIYKEAYELLTGGRDALLKHWKWAPENNTWQLDKTIPAHNYTVNKIAMSPDGKLFATAGRDKTAKIWRSADLELLKVMDLKKYPNGHTHSVNTLLWASNDHLVTAGDDKRILGWRVAQS